MAYKFPWTNYHELNLDWILDTVKKLFAQTEQNNEIVTQYDGRLSEVELIADNAQTAAIQAQSNSATALDLAQNAAQTATQAQQAAAQAQQAAGQAQTAAGQALEAAATAQQTATQAQQTAQNFDGRITQAENNAASALQAAQAFDEQVQGAITAANNANEAATAALTSATETARELAAQRDTLEGIVSDGVDSLQEAAQDATEEIETVGQSVLNSIPADYTALSELVDRKADVIYNTAAGEIASFNDGADDMKIKSLIVNIEPVQSGSGDPSPDNVRPISGLSEANVERTGKNLFGGVFHQTNAARIDSDTLTLPAGTYTVSVKYSGTPVWGLYVTGITNIYNANTLTFTLTKQTTITFHMYHADGISVSEVTEVQVESGSIATAYEQYNGDKITVNFEDEAGIIYGGTLNVITGELIVDSAIMDMGAMNWNYSSSEYRFYSTSARETIAKRILATASVFKCSSLKTANGPIALLTPSGDHTICSYSNGYVYARSLEYTDADAFKAAYNGQTIWFKIETPVTYQLTPQQVKTLYQYNNIWSDVGSVDVEYPADTKTYIDNKFAELQALILEH